ncbi:MAG: 4-hydroxythreonine-4-phosphate dehydrogenase PdxA [Alphaproteobacteria bacterium]|nr:4-hydroxythreonine-4-phosphate dehydrogenase PdxA [Alphaproteobacteria bacterium]
MKPLVITMGEPAGVGGELTISAWNKRQEMDLPVFFALDCPKRLKTINPECPIKEIAAPEEAADIFDHTLPVLPIELSEEPKAGELNSANAKAVIESIERGVRFCLGGQAAGIVTNPIHKAALYEAGFNRPGHTEFIGDLCEETTGENTVPVMMLAAKGLRVVPLTVHIPLKDVPASINPEILEKTASIIDESMRKDFKIDSPRIAVAGLNPHAGEEGKIGVEDRDVVAPAIRSLQKNGMDISGPYPADTMFHEEVRTGYDIAIGMYHDQALIPLKTLDFHGGVNVTIGLPIVRTSPDHGTALDIAGKAKARADSFINAIKMAEEMAKNRAAT